MVKINPILYNEHESKFDNNGIGVLSDTISCIVTEERNGIYELEMRYPVSGIHYSEIKCRRIITAKPAVNRGSQPFRICRISKPINGIISIYAQHISYDLTGIVAEPFTAGSAVQAMAMLESKTYPKNNFTMWTNKQTEATMDNKIPASVRNRLGGSEGSIIDTYGGELEFDQFTVKLWEKRGQDNGVSIRYGKNLTDLKQEENCSKVRTGIYPYWTNQNTGELVTLPEKIVKAPGTYDFESILPVDFSQKFREKPTEDQLRTSAQNYAKRNKIGIPKINLSVSYVNQENLTERVNLCDIVTISFPAMGVRATAKVTKTIFNVLLDRMDKVEIGDTRPSIADTIAGQASEIKKIPSNAVIQSLSMQATAEILGAVGGSVRLLDENDDGMPDTLYIADDPDPEKAIKVWRYNYEGWAASKNGYNGPFSMAASLEKGFYADFITAGKLNADLIKAGTITDSTGKNYWNVETGELVLDAKTLKVQGVTPQEMAETAESNAKSAASSELSAYKKTVEGITADLQNQIDGSITTWFRSEIPTPNNLPASDWKTNEEKNRHLGDLYYIVDNKDAGGHVYRWANVGGSYKWEMVEDTEITKALAQAAEASRKAGEAQQTADGKMRVFGAQPVPPYSVNDLWTKGETGGLYRCKVSKESGAFSEADWELATDYVNKTAAESAAQEKIDAQTQQDIFNKLTDNGKAQGIYLENGKLYISAEYIVSGILKDKNNNFVINLNTGNVDIKKGSINLGNGNFSVNDSGYMQSTSGKIGGFDIGSDSISNSALSLNAHGLHITDGAKAYGNFDHEEWGRDRSKIGVGITIDKDGSFISINNKNNKSFVAFVSDRSLPTPNQPVPANTIFLSTGTNFGGWPAENLYFNPDTGGAIGGITGTMRFTQILGIDQRDGTATEWLDNCYLEFKHGVLVRAKFHS